MKKEDVRVLVDTPKKVRKLYKVLKMFNQPIFRTTEERLREGFVHDDFKYIHERDDCWSGISNSGKQAISIKQLKQILAKECLKKGDYIVGSVYGLDDFEFVAEFESFDNEFFPIVGSRYSILSEGESIQNVKCRFSYFKRYATKKEIRKLKDTSESLTLDNIKLGTWYKYPEYDKWMACFTEKTDKGVTGYGFNVEGIWQDIKLEGHRLHTLVEVPFEDIKGALFREAKKRYKVGDKVSRLNTRFPYDNSSDEVIRDLDTLGVNSVLGVVCHTTIGFPHQIFYNGEWAEIIPEVELNLGDYIMLKSNRKGIDQLTFKKVTDQNKSRLESCVKDGSHIHITDRELIKELDKH